MSLKAITESAEPFEAAQKKLQDQFLHGVATVLDAREDQTSSGLHVEQELVRLAALSPAEYGRCRQEASERLKIPLAFLDREMEQRHKDANGKRVSGQGEEINFDEICPAAEPVDGGQLLGDLLRIFHRFLVLPPHGDVTLALWVIFAHCLVEFQIAPRLVVRSPEKRCGKTTVLELLSYLVPRGLLSSNLSAATVFRVIGSHNPTLLIDEMDSFTEKEEELRGILNSGHTRAAARILRVVGEQHEVRSFSTWCPMVLACIGQLPETLEDRSIIIPMRRKTARDRVESLLQTGPGADTVRLTFTALARRIARWVQDSRLQLHQVSPPIPEDLGDRAKNNWFPLLTIAEVVGGQWPQCAVAAALALSGQVDTDADSIRVQLLADIRGLFESTAADKFSSDDLSTQLTQLEERPWKEWRKGKPLSTHQLAGLLRPFEVRSRNLRLPGGQVLKGYPVEAFLDAWTRYLPPLSPDSPLSNRYNATTLSQSGDEPLFQSATEGACSGSENAMNPAPDAGCSAVADQNPESREEEEFFEDT